MTVFYVSLNLPTSSVDIRFTEDTWQLYTLHCEQLFGFQAHFQDLRPGPILIPEHGQLASGWWLLASTI